MAKTGKEGKEDKDKANMHEPDKVVSFSGNSTKNASGKRRKNSGPSKSTPGLSYDKLNNYKMLLELQAQVMDELYQLTEDMLQELHYQADKFSLNENSALDFLDVNMHDFIAGAGEILDLVFDAKIDGETYKAFVSAFCMEDRIEMNGMMSKYDDLNKQWLMYTDVGGWVPAPEEVSFYLEDY